LQHTRRPWFTNYRRPYVYVDEGRKFSYPGQMYTIQSRFGIMRASGVRFIIAVGLLITGFSSHGLCVEPDGASHVASRDHQCCDPDSSDRGGPVVGFDAGESPSLHECAHVPLVQATLILHKSDRNASAAVSTPPHLSTFDRTFEADTARPEHLGYVCSRTPLSTALRL
jgi:hypothetical protein